MAKSIGELDLDALFDRALRLRAFDGGAFDGREPMGAVAFEVEGGDIRALRDAIVTDGWESHACRCRGDVALVLEGPEGSAGRVVVHHGETVRFAGAHGEHALDIVGEALVRCLAEHGLEAPLRAYERLEALYASATEERRLWILNAPPALRLRLDALEAGEMSPDDALSLLATQYANVDDVAAALLAWMGDPHEPWDTPTAHDSIPRALLDRTALDAIQRVVMGSSPESAEVVGAGRYLAMASPARRSQLGAEALARLRARASVGLGPNDARVAAEAFRPSAEVPRQGSN